ncbi:MAG: lysylphosphatidylglycerol synthase domain-containing protein [Planctomycetota bacterium]|nr:lysylphosphatidylglycerol synthase domain-containing protein [Planctomycetota bacterium]
MTRPSARIAISVVIALAAVALLLWWGGVRGEEILDALVRCGPGPFVAVLGIQATIHLLRGARLAGLLRAMGDEPPPVSGLTASSAAWILDSQVLPGRIGEATLVLHLRRIGVDPEHGVVGLLLSRLLDLFTLSAILTGASAAMLALGTHERIEFLAPLAGARGALTAALGLAILRGGSVVGIARAAVARTGVGRFGPGARALDFGARVESALRSVPRGALGRAAVVSLGVTASIVIAYGVLGTGVGLPELGPLGLTFGACFAILGSLVPISGFLGIGAFDMAWAFGFASLGVPEDVAVSTGLAFHALYLVQVAVHGAWGHLLLARAARRRA